MAPRVPDPRKGMPDPKLTWGKSSAGACWRNILIRHLRQRRPTFIALRSSHGTDIRKGARVQIPVRPVPNSPIRTTIWRSTGSRRGTRYAPPTNSRAAQVSRSARARGRQRTPAIAVCARHVEIQGPEETSASILDFMTVASRNEQQTPGLQSYSTLIHEGRPVPLHNIQPLVRAFVPIGWITFRVAGRKDHLGNLSARTTKCYAESLPKLKRLSIHASLALPRWRRPATLFPQTLPRCFSRVNWPAAYDGPGQSGEDRSVRSSTAAGLGGAN